MNKSLLIRSILIGIVAGIVFYGALTPKVINADSESDNSNFCKAVGIVKTIKMIVTAYSSTPDQTDDTPFINAAGYHVKDGDIAINGLPFGTIVRIPEISGSKEYVVKDRMNPKMGRRHADVWFPTYQQAKEFGARYNVKVEILES